MFEPLWYQNKGKRGGRDEKSREDEYDTQARDCEDGGVEYEDVAHFQASDGE